MGTRGVYGIRKNGVDKVAYNHYSSDPDYLGMEMVKFCSEHSVDDLNKMYDNIEMVDELEKPSRTEIDVVDSFLNTDRKRTPDTTWYDLLHSFQGNMDLLDNFMKVNNGVGYMTDAEDFIKNSLHCEYGYIINLDDNKLEFWEGFQRESDPNNRYGTDTCDFGNEFYPCRLNQEFSLSSLENKKISPEKATFKMNWNCRNEKEDRRKVTNLMKKHNWYVTIDKNNCSAEFGYTGLGNATIFFWTDFDGTVYDLVSNIIDQLKDFDANEYVTDHIEADADRDIQDIRNLCDEGEVFEKECKTMARLLEDADI